MSYLVEQPPYCDLLRLSLSTRRFVIPRKRTGNIFGLFESDVGSLSEKGRHKQRRRGLTEVCRREHLANGRVGEQIVQAHTHHPHLVEAHVYTSKESIGGMWLVCRRYSHDLYISARTWMFLQEVCDFAFLGWRRR